MNVTYESLKERVQATLAELSTLPEADLRQLADQAHLDLSYMNTVKVWSFATEEERREEILSRLQQHVLDDVRGSIAPAVSSGFILTLYDRWAAADPAFRERRERALKRMAQMEASA